MQNNGTNSLRKLRRDWWKTRLCTSCVSPLGRIISRGGNCPQCGLRVCKDCRKEIQPGSGAWICVLCTNGDGGIPSDIFGKTKSLGRDSRLIRRSWTISTPNRAQTNSPILKSYTIIQPEESLGGTSSFNSTGQNGGSVLGGSRQNSDNDANSHRQFHSLPRMSSGSERSKKTKRSFNQDFEKENIKRHRSFQSTLHPYQAPTPPSPTTSINFIEDPFWDYYDYDIDETPSNSPRSPRAHNNQLLRNPKFRSLPLTCGSAGILQRRNSIKNKLESDMDRLLRLNLRSSPSNRSSCERSLGETYDYDYSKNYSFSNYTSLSDTELNDASKYEQEEYSSHNATFSPPRRFSHENTNFYKFATVTPLNMSPLSEPRKVERNVIPSKTNNFPGVNLTSTSTSTPVKPERKCNRNKRSFSLNSYDTGKKLFSPLRTYVVVMKENVMPRTNNVISDASSSSANVNANSNASGGENNRKKNQHCSYNTSSILLNSSSSSATPGAEVEFKRGDNSPTRFHSLPRERVIKIEREDWKFGRSSGNNEKLHGQNLNFVGSTPTSAGDRRRNISKVEITRSASAKDFQTGGGSLNVVKLSVDKGSGRRIARSQSHREMSSLNRTPSMMTYEVGHHKGRDEIANIANLRSRSTSTPSPNSGGGSARNESANLSLIRGKGGVSPPSTTLTSSAKPLLSSLLDDRETAAVMENFLRSPSQNQNPSRPTTTSSATFSPSYKTGTGRNNSAGSCDSGGVDGRTNEKSSKADFLQSQMSDFEHFQRQQIQTFDNCLRQCSTFPRALQKQKQLKREQEQDLKSQQEVGNLDNVSNKNQRDFESEPKSRVRHTSTTQITHDVDDNFVKSWDEDDNPDDEYYFHPVRTGGRVSRPRARSEVQLNAFSYDYPSNGSKNTTSVAPIVPMKQSDTTDATGPNPPIGWSATLPHPYVRRHKQQKSTFIQEQGSTSTAIIDDAFSKEKTRISNIEQEIERDIYFQKTKSLDRVRPRRSKPSLFDTKFERSQNNDISPPPAVQPPVASPRLKRKAKLLESINGSGGSNLNDVSFGSSIPKINAEPYQQNVNGTGSVYPVKNKTSSAAVRLPNEPRAWRDLNSNPLIQPPTSTSHSNSHPSQSHANNKFILESQSQFGNNSLTNSNSTKQSGTKFAYTLTDSQISDHDHDQTKSRMKIVPNYSQKSIPTTQQVVEDGNTETPIATPRTRRKNSNPNHNRSDSVGLVDDEEVCLSHNFHSQNHKERTMEGDTLNGINSAIGKLLPQSSSQNNNLNLPKAVRFEVEPHVIETQQDGRKHNKSSNGNSSSARITNINANTSSPSNGGGSGMRMNNNNFNNKLKPQPHLGMFNGSDTSTSNGNIVDSSVSQSSSDTKPISGVSTSTKSGAYPYNYYNAGGGPVYSFRSSPPPSDKALKSIKKPPLQSQPNGGFVARAIAKVKSKAKLKKGKKNNGTINSGSGAGSGLITKLRSIETRDSITYISPPPTSTQHNKQQYANGNGKSISVLQEITLNPIILSNSDYGNGSGGCDDQVLSSNLPTNRAISRNESFSKGGILKNSTAPTTQILNQTISSGSGANNTPQNLKSPPKPKRSSLKKKSSDMSLQEGGTGGHPVDLPTPPLPLPSLSTDQLTPSSTSSSASSSYLSNLHESYDFFNASEECESLDGDEDQELGEGITEQVEVESDSENVFKSFEDDEDAGEDFIFYSQTDPDSDSGNKTKEEEGMRPLPSHPYPKTSSQNQTNNQFPMNNNLNQNKNYREILLSSNSASATSTTKSQSLATQLITIHSSKSPTTSNSSGDQNHHHHLNHGTKGVEFDFSTSTITTSTSPLRMRLSDPPPPPPPATSPTLRHNFYNHSNEEAIIRSGNQNNNNIQGIRGENSNYFGRSGSQFEENETKDPSPSRSRLDDISRQRERDSLLAQLYQTSHLLLPHFSGKSATLPSRRGGRGQYFTESEFFPGSGGRRGQLSETEGMSSSSSLHQTSTLPKFKSRVLVNNSEGSEVDPVDVKEYFGVRAISPEIPAIPRQGGRGRGGGGGGREKNVTTVEISGDVGIVNSQAASAFLNERRSQLKKVNNESLWKERNDVYSSGLSKLKNQELLEGQDDNNIHSSTTGNSSSAAVDHELPEVEEDIHNYDGGGSASTLIVPRKSVSSSISDDGSDWHSESTKNTVIFRGGGGDIGGTGSSNSSESLHLSPAASTSSTGGGGVFNYNCDPEIHISNIDLVDNYDNDGSGVTDETGNCVKSTSITAKSAKLTLSNANSNKAAEVAVDDKRIDQDISWRKGKNVKSLGNSANSGGNTDCDNGRNGVKNVNSSEPHVEFLPKSNLDHSPPQSQMPKELDDEMVQCNLNNVDKALSGSSHATSPPRPVPSNNGTQPRRESPEGQEQEIPPTHRDSKEEPINDVKAATTTEPKKKALRVGEVIIMDHPGKGSSSGKVLSKSEISQAALSRISRSSPDGADADRSEADSTTTTEPEGDSPTPMIEHFDVTSDEDSWVEEIIFEDDSEPSSIQMCRKAQPPPLDLTLHTIVEESCEESETESQSGNFDSPQKIGGGSGGRRQKGRLSNTTNQQQNDNELEKYFNFGINTGDNGSTGGRQSFSNEDSEFSDDTFSESSFSMQDDHDEGGHGASNSSHNSGRKQRTSSVEMDPAELASSRLEKYFYNLGLPQSMINPISSIKHQTGDSEDSVGSESESDNSLLENRKKVLKHHRRSADFEDEFAQVSDEEEDFGFGQDGFDTIKKTANRKGAKKGGSGSDSNLGVESSAGGSSGLSKSENTMSTSSSSPRPNNNAILHLDPILDRMTKSPLEKTSSNGTSSSKDDSTSSASPTTPSTSKKSFPPGTEGRDRPVVKVNRSNSFQWSSDEEVNIMMSKLRQLIRNLVKAKTEQPTSSSSGASSISQPAGDKDKQLAYLESELIRLMKTENLKNIVEYFSSEESDVDDVYKFIKVVKESSSNGDEDNSDFGEIDLEDPDLLQSLHTTMQKGDSASGNLSPKGSPALLAKVMGHIGNRLAVWMKDENMEDNNDDTVTLKCAQSISSDLNEDRFSWKGSFESALAAKRQSVGSTDSISSSDFTQDRSILRSSSLHHLANSAHHLGQVEEHKEEEDTASSLPRMTNLCNSLPRLNQPSNLSISRAQSLVISAEEGDSPVTTPTTGPIKSARYRPPGFQPVKSKRIDDEGKNSSILSQSTPMLTQDPGLKIRSDSVGSIFHDATKPHIPVKGQVEFGLQYNYKLACLEVRVKQCRELAAVDSKRNRSDPYVKAYLLPDRSKNGKRKTKVKKNTLNPVFEEVLKFPLTLSDLQNRTLWLSVWHSDIFGKNEFLGEVLVELKDRVFDDISTTSWDLQEMSGQTEDMPRGDLVIALKWQPKTESTGNLSVLVKEAKNLAPVKNGGSPSSFVKCSLLSDSRKQKTSVCRRNNHPVWNQTFSFEDAGIDGLEITLWNHDLLSNNDLLGTVRIEYDHPLWGSMLSRRLWVEGILRLT